MHKLVALAGLAMFRQLGTKGREPFENLAICRRARLTMQHVLYPRMCLGLVSVILLDELDLEIHHCVWYSRGVVNVLLFDHLAFWRKKLACPPNRLADQGSSRIK